MSRLEIHRSVHRDTYTTVDNTVIRDHRLSVSAKGVMLTLLSFPDTEWEISHQRLAKCSNDSRYAIEKATKELQHYGYLDIESQRDSKGKIAEHCWHVYEAGKAVAKTQSELPEPGYQDMDKNAETRSGLPHPEIPDPVSPDLEYPDPENPDSGYSDVYKEPYIQITPIKNNPTANPVKKLSASKKKESAASDPDSREVMAYLTAALKRTGAQAGDFGTKWHFAGCQTAKTMLETRSVEEIKKIIDWLIAHPNLSRFTRSMSDVGKYARDWSLDNASKVENVFDGDPLARGVK